MSSVSSEQIEMNYDRPISAPPVAAPDEVDSFVMYLACRGWLSAREIIAENPPTLHLPRGFEAAKRKLRTIAEAGENRILSYPGSKGYRVLIEANVEEINHGIRAHRSQARKHVSRMVALQRYKHSRE